MYIDGGYCEDYSKRVIVCSCIHIQLASDFPFDLQEFHQEGLLDSDDESAPCMNDRIWRLFCTKLVSRRPLTSDACQKM